VEELLRFAGPLQVALPCRTTEPVELGGGDDSQWSWAG
jgi:cytochrome P450